MIGQLSALRGTAAEALSFTFEQIVLFDNSRDGHLL
jgi:hypothetical protein